MNCKKGNEFKSVSPMFIPAVQDKYLKIESRIPYANYYIERQTHSTEMIVSWV